MEDYEIKVDGREHAFEGGAIRYEKDKGRFDLIPMDVENRVLQNLSQLQKKLQYVKRLQATDTTNYGTETTQSNCMFNKSKR